MPSSLLQSLILAFVALGVMIPFRLLNFPDLTCEGAYPLGGALCASMLLAGLPALLATICAMLMGGILGLGTAFVHLRFKVNTLLAGILLSTMVYSINLRIMGKPNLAIFDSVTLFSNLSDNIFIKILILLAFNILILLLLTLFLNTQIGLCLRAVGLNPIFAQKNGIHTSSYIYLGLFIGNSLSALGASLMVQIQHYADIGMGVGIVIHALAAMMIGECLIGSSSLKRQIIAPFIGALIYQQIQGIALSLGLAPTDLKLVTGLIVLLAIGFRRQRHVFAA
jgi:putative ABC transport system permease protein